MKQNDIFCIVAFVFTVFCFMLFERVRFRGGILVTCARTASVYRLRNSMLFNVLET
jgi:hypothetical protein